MVHQTASHFDEKSCTDGQYDIPHMPCRKIVAILTKKLGFCAFWSTNAHCNRFAKKYVHSEDKNGDKL